MAFALVNNSFSATAFTATSVSIGPADQTAGNLVVLLVTYTTGGIVTAVTDDISSAFVLCTGSQVDNGTFVSELWYCKNVGGRLGNNWSLIMQTATTELSISMLQYSGGSTTAPFDKASAATAVGTSVSAASISPAGAGELSVSCICCAVSGTPFTATQGTGYTIVDNSGFLWGEHNLSVSSGQIGDWTSNVNQRYNVTQALFSTTAIVGGSTPRMLATLGAGN